MINNIDSAKYTDVYKVAIGQKLVFNIYTCTCGVIIMLIIYCYEELNLIILYKLINDSVIIIIIIKR